MDVTQRAVSEIKWSTLARQNCHCWSGCGDLFGGYLSPGSRLHLEVSSQGRYLFSKSLHTRSATKQMQGLSFSRTRAHKIWLSLKLIWVANHHASFPFVERQELDKGDSVLLNCSCDKRLLPNKLEIPKYQSHLFPFMPNRQISCPNLPASAPTKCYMLRWITYLPFRIQFSPREQITVQSSLLLGKENYMWKSWFALCVCKKLPTASIAYKYACTHLYNLDWQERGTFRNLPTAIFLLFFCPTSVRCKGWCRSSWE